MYVVKYAFEFPCL